MSVAVDLELTPVARRGARRWPREHTLVPLRHTFIADCETPVSAYLKLRGDGPSFLLESAEQGQRVGRWSFLGFQPAHASTHGVGRAASTRRPLRAVAEELERYRIAPLDGLPPFAGGAVGMFGYDLVRYAEPTVGEPNPDETRRAGPGADGHRRPARLRPPPPRGHGARQRLRRAATSSAPTRRPPRRSPTCASGCAARCPRAGARHARARPSSTSNLGPGRLRRGRRAGEGVHPRGRRLPGGPEPALDARTAPSTRSRSTAACARSTRARTCTSSTSRTSRSRARRPSRS